MTEHSSASKALSPVQAARQRWMGILARAKREDLAAHEQELQSGAYEILRAPETGMVMTRARVGGTGAPFSLGEMTITRCAVRLENGVMGSAYVAGRDKRHAKLAALADARLQDADGERWKKELIEPLAAAIAARHRKEAAETAATRVDFFTLARGDA
ncbi:MAG: phosphonate C-P lyase system protein PhnG [Zoogloeaceae bacterium]|nr:phosphonate C-P lyase system protein PhnG [Zoogloeaceae bacterium]